MDTRVELEQLDPVMDANMNEGITERNSCQEWDERVDLAEAQVAKRSKQGEEEYWGEIGGFGAPVADPETAELVIACHDHGLPWAWTDSKKDLRARLKKADADLDGLYEKLRRVGMVE